MLRKLGRIPVALAVVGAYLNTAQLLAEFQPDGFAWVGWLGAASIGVGLFLSVEALLHRYHPVLLMGILFFGTSELAGQILHAALVRSDVVVMTEAMRWLLGYAAPGFVVLSGIVMAFVVHFGFPQDGDEDPASPVTREDLLRLERSVSTLAFAAAASLGEPSVNGKRNGKVAQPSTQIPLELPVLGDKKVDAA